MALYEYETNGQLEPWVEREWLLTNGMGSFCGSTVVGCNSRRYHGLLCAATVPPVGRVMALSRIGEILQVDGSDRMLEFSVNRFADRWHPRGDQYLRRFSLDETARFEFDVEGISIVKEVMLCWMRNVAAVRYTLKGAGKRKMHLSLLPFTGLRDFHALRRSGSGAFQVEASNDAMQVKADGNRLFMKAEGAVFRAQADWWYGHKYSIDTERGQEDTEDLFSPGRFDVEGEGELAVTLWAGIEPLGAMKWDEQLAERMAAKKKRLGKAKIAAKPSATLQRLIRASDDFVVARKAPDGKAGTTIIAGYPWFADWGRDTMIALPGLLLAMERFEEARQVLTVFASYVSEGMIPNRFDDYTNEPSYNTVDASLWFIHAVHEYARLAKDSATLETVLRPACRAIVDGYRAGTRFHIRMDPADGLITQGDANTQLTWMDAKCNGIAFTPRQGKAVEINALWHHGLVLMGENELAGKVAASFRKLFWISPWRGLADVADGGHRDEAIRPNQIFAASLAHSPLTAEQRAAVVEVVRRELLTPVGLRTLPGTNPRYHGRYTGPQMQRDEAYHNGTVWPWLIGAFLEGYLKVQGDSAEARAQCRQWLSPLVEHLNEACIGQISEVFDGDPPFRPGGCCAQAWSIAEVLRLAIQLEM